MPFTVPSALNDMSASGKTPRSKTGCHTCRFRRKKCDVDSDEHDGSPCKTCQRLEIECVGYGLNRPWFMKGDDNERRIREDINDFLIMTNKARGRLSPNASRKNYAPGSTLKLRPEPRSVLNVNPISASVNTYSHEDIAGAPPTRFLGLKTPKQDNNNHGYPSLDFGNIFPEMESSTYIPSSASSLSSSSSLLLRGGYGDSSIPVAGAAVYITCSGPSDASQVSEKSTLNYQQCPSAAAAASWQAFAPQTKKDNEDNEEIVSPTCGPPSSPTTRASTTMTSLQRMGFGAPIPSSSGQDLTQVYVTRVSSRAYMLADPSVFETISVIIQQSRIAQCSMFILCCTYLVRTGSPWSIWQSDLMVESQSIVHGLKVKCMSPSPMPLTSGEALGALHLVSNSLFSAQTQPWKPFLLGALKYTGQLLESHHIRQLSNSDLFILQTTAWFATMAAVSHDVPDHYVRFLRELFKPPQTAEEQMCSPPDMYTIMGAENHVVWAIAETTLVARDIERQSMSMDDVCDRLGQVESYLGQTRLVHQEELRAMAVTQGSDPDQNKDVGRQVTAALFHNAAILFLYSVWYDSRPSNAAIATAVDAIITLLQSYHQQYVLSRMGVFAIYLSGALSDRLNHREFLEDLLMRQSEERVGNTSTVLDALRDVWQTRAQDGWMSDARINWREPLVRRRLLLV